MIIAHIVHSNEVCMKYKLKNERIEFEFP